MNNTRVLGKLSDLRCTENREHVIEYLHYKQAVLQHEEATIRRHSLWLRHLLLWADPHPFCEAPDVQPVFPQYLLSAKRGDKPDEKLSAVGIKRNCQAARTFFKWLRETYPDENGNLTPAWVRTIRSPRLPQEPPKKLRSVSLDTVRALMAVPDDSLTIKRNKAAAAFLFLSGMRASAFCTLRLDCVNIANRTVHQFPTRGVLTKNMKAATTYLLNISELMEIVSEWDSFVRSQLPASGMWYSHIRGSRHNKLRLYDIKPGVHRRANLGDHIRGLFELAELPAQPPHEFRHGHAVYCLKRARDMGDLKAVSMNLMHSSISITDSIYAVLPTDDVKSRLDNLSKNGVARNNNGNQEVISYLHAIIAKLEMER